MKNEPKIPPLLSKNSFLRMPTAAMRSAPEVLTLELYRKIFYRIDRNEEKFKKDKALHPAELIWTDEERFTIEAFRGRRKLAGDRKSFYAPAFPSLARDSWLRAKDPVTVNGFLFEGPIAHALKSKNLSSSAQESFVNLIITSLLDDSDNKDSFVYSLEDAPEMFDKEIAKRELNDYLERELGNTQTLTESLTDVFSIKAYEDFVYLLSLQEEIPRTLWISMLQGFLRLTMSVSLLGQMKSSEILWYWIENTINGNQVPSQDEIDQAFKHRHKDLFQPSAIEFEGLSSVINSYSKTRVKLTVFLEVCRDMSLINSDEYENPFSISSDPQLLDVREFLWRIFNQSGVILNKMKEELIEGEENTFEAFMDNKCRKFSLYNKGIVGQSKNISEFLKILEKSEGFDDKASHIFEKVIRGRKSHQFRASPGNLLIEMMILFADLNKFKDRVLRSRDITLVELEEHFKYYGVNYTLAADGRKMLMSKLASAGVLSGSPDAGDSISVINPYRRILSKINSKSGALLP